jgi:hypothetical protein
VSASSTFSMVRTASHRMVSNSIQFWKFCLCPQSPSIRSEGARLPFVIQAARGSDEPAAAVARDHDGYLVGGRHVVRAVSSSLLPASTVMLKRSGYFSSFSTSALVGNVGDGNDVVREIEQVFFCTGEKPPQTVTLPSALLQP